MPLPQIPKNRPVRLLRKGDLVRIRGGSIRTIGRKGVVFNHPISLDDNVLVLVNGTTWIFHESSLEKLSIKYYYTSIPTSHE
jgi:hypothetical protein